MRNIQKQNVKRWVVVFRALANTNRLKIIRMLRDGRKMSVTDISSELRISFKATSNHLAMLRSLDVLEATGTEGRVLYSVNSGMPEDFYAAIGLIK